MSERTLNITRVANYIFLEICEAYQNKDYKLEAEYLLALELVERIEREQEAVFDT